MKIRPNYPTNLIVIIVVIIVVVILDDHNVDGFGIFLAIVAAVLKFDRDDLARNINRQPSTKLVIDDINDIKEELAFLINLNKAKTLVNEIDNNTPVNIFTNQQLFIQQHPLQAIDT